MPPLEVVRLIVFGLFVLALAVATASWALQTRRIAPFSRAARGIRKLIDPVLDPVETLVLRRGGNPQHAGWWLVGIVVVGGILAMSVAQWAATQWFRFQGAADAGPRGLARLAVYYAGQLVLLGLLARVIGSWFGVGRYNRWMRPAYLLTDWIVQPLSRIVPPLGMVDITPLVAWFILTLVLRWVMTML